MSLFFLSINFTKPRNHHSCYGRKSPIDFTLSEVLTLFHPSQHTFCVCHYRWLHRVCISNCLSSKLILVMHISVSAFIRMFNLFFAPLSTVIFISFISFVFSSMKHTYYFISSYLNVFFNAIISFGKVQFPQMHQHLLPGIFTYHLELFHFDSTFSSHQLKCCTPQHLYNHARLILDKYNRSVSHLH